MNDSIDLIATTAFGLEAVVRRELADLGYSAAVCGPGRVHFQSDSTAICRANIWLRTADRVLVQIARFPAEDFDTLFETTRSLGWHEWIPPDAAFPVVGRSHKSQAVQRARMPAGGEEGRRRKPPDRGHHTTSLPESGATFRIEVAILDNQVSLTLDTTGPSLHKRGYRRSTAPAPLKETLAAALVLLSFWKPDRPLIDPFCGSGTIPIEAALIGRQIAPGADRPFASEAWPVIEAQLWLEARNEAHERGQATLSERVVGTDRDPRALQGARRNAERAGVGEDVHFQQRSFEDLSSKRQFGCVITNPPYGERLADQGDLELLYQSMPEVLRKIPTWSHFILTAYPNFEKLVQKQADRRRKLYNGRIECTYYQFHGPKPELVAAGTRSAVAVNSKTDESPDASTVITEPKPPDNIPVFGGLTEHNQQQAELFRRRLEKRARHLRRWPTKQGITCYRLYDRDIPEIPLVVDRYEDHLHMAEYERPHSRDRGQHADWLELMVRTAGKVFEIDRRKIFLKRRQRQRGTTQHQHLGDQQYEITVHEGGLQFLVNLSDYVDTGLFLDHRLTRAMVRDHAAGKRFLNLFAYSGTFSVYAASGGAAQTTTVDWSPRYITWAQRNMQCNGFTGPEHKFVRDDVREFLGGLPRTALFDLAVVDPPTFSNSKRTDTDWEIQRDHVELINEVLLRMTPGGLLYFSSNFRRFKLDETAISARHIREISRQTVPPDFRNRRIHRCWRIVRDE